MQRCRRYTVSTHPAPRGAPRRRDVRRRTRRNTGAASHATGSTGTPSRHQVRSRLRAPDRRRRVRSQTIAASDLQCRLARMHDAARRPPDRHTVAVERSRSCRQSARHMRATAGVVEQNATLVAQRRRFVQETPERLNSVNQSTLVRDRLGNLNRESESRGNCRSPAFVRRGTVRTIK